MYIYIFRRADPLFANSSRSVSATDAKLCLITGRRMGSVIGGRRKMICYGREERRTDSHSLMEIDAMFFVRIRMANARFRTRCCV